jgi:hypothetical protein
MRDTHRFLAARPLMGIARKRARSTHPTRDGSQVARRHQALGHQRELMNARSVLAVLKMHRRDNAGFDQVQKPANRSMNQNATSIPIA